MPNVPKILQKLDVEPFEINGKTVSPSFNFAIHTLKKK